MPLVRPVTVAENCCATCVVTEVRRGLTTTPPLPEVTTVTLAAADLVASAAATAVTLTCAGEGTTAGAVYSPAAEIVPSVALPPLTPPTCQVTLPLLLLDRLWCFVYSTIPLKDGLDRTPWFLGVNLVYACICAALCGSAARSFQRTLLIAAAATASAAFALWTSIGATPTAYVCLVLMLVPVSSLFAFTWRKFT